jgi:methyl-accepting chemotaxis protein/preprotein translocase subunit SecG
MSRKQSVSKYHKGRSRVLYQITAFLIVLFILSGVAIFFSYRSSQNRQIQESIDSLLVTYNENVADSFKSMDRALRALAQASFPEVGSQENINALLEEQQTPVQGLLDGELKKITDAEVLGAEVVLAMLMPSSQAQQPVVVASSDEGLVYKWEMPGYLTRAIQDGEPYLYLPDGMPELGLADETLVLFNMGDSQSSNFPITLVSVVSIHDELVAINAFYDQQRKDASIALGLIILVSLILLSLLSYLGLAYLIRKRINQPIDELAAAAEEVIGGKLDVKIEIRKGEEFEGLKYAFRELLDTFRAMLSRSVGENEASPRQESPKPKKGRSRVLYQMTAFLVILFILSGLGIFFSFRGIRNRQFEESVDYLISDYSEIASETFDTMSPLLLSLGTITVPPYESDEPIRALTQKLITPTIAYINEWMKKMIDERIMDADSMFMVVMPSAFIPEAEVFMSSDESLLYKWKVPDYLTEAIDEGLPYIYLPDGMPELGLSEEALVAIKRFDGSGYNASFVGVVSVHDKVAVINDFYNKQKRDSAILLALIMLISAIILSLLSFFGLKYLIGKRITKPVDELAAVAEELMEGNLDVKIEIRKGEEFEGLKQAFKELLDVISNLVSRSVIDDED